MRGKRIGRMDVCGMVVVREGLGLLGGGGVKWCGVRLVGGVGRRVLFVG